MVPHDFAPEDWDWICTTRSNCYSRPVIIIAVGLPRTLIQSTRLSRQQG